MSPHESRDEPDLREQFTAAANLASVDDRTALDQLLDANYAHLRRIAHALVARETPGHSVEATGLVHAAYERLIDNSNVTRHGSMFFRTAFARTARRILVERARARRAAKRGGPHHKEELQSAHLRVNGSFDLLALDEVMTRLAELPNTGTRMAAVVELRVFSGMSVPECAEALGVSRRTIDQDWKLGRKFLERHLSP